MFTEFRCCAFQPTLLCAPLAFSCAFFFALYGPPYDASRIQLGACAPQSLYGTPSRPTVQSNRGSTGTLLPATKFSADAFHADEALRGVRSPWLMASGSPFAS